jgi:hypothetical protein
MTAEIAKLSDERVEKCRDDQGRPCLQRLVAAYGGYNRIPADAWRAWDAMVAAYRERLRAIAPAANTRPQAIKRFYLSSEECCRCYEHGTFGYCTATLSEIGQADLISDESGETIWFCDRHRPAEYFADARRR